MSGTVYAIEYQGAFVKVTMRIVGDEEFVAYCATIGSCAIRSRSAMPPPPAGSGPTCTLRADLGRAALDAGRLSQPVAPWHRPPSACHLSLPNVAGISAIGNR